MLVLTLGFVVGLGVGAKYHTKIMPCVAAGEAWISTWKKRLTKSQ